MGYFWNFGIDHHQDDCLNAKFNFSSFFKITDFFLTAVDRQEAAR